MTSLADIGRAKSFWLVLIWVVNLTMLTGAAWHYTPSRESAPLGAPVSFPKSLAMAELLPGRSGNQNIRPSSLTTTTIFAPFLNIVPGNDGTTLFIGAGTNEVAGTVVANVTIGGTSHKGGTMVYSNTLQAYIVTIDPPGLVAGNTIDGNLSITTTTGLDTGSTDFNRVYVPASTSQIITSLDGNLQLSVVSTDTITHDTYIAVVPSYGAPGSPPPGHRLVGSIYSVRASGALLVTSEPMLLRLYYNSAGLIGTDPHTLAIFAWDAFNRRWDNLAGDLSSTQSYLSVTTSRFTTYALMATPTWRDEFDEFSGLDFSQFNNVTFGGTPGNRTLILVSAPGSGSAISQPITPTTTFPGWDTLNFTGVVTPPTTSLTIDILGADGSAVLTNVSNGASLASLELTHYPALRLRLNLTSLAANQTPALADWRLSWQVEEKRIYLPIVLK